MNQTISQMRAVHEGLRQRTQAATAEYESKSRLSTPRFVVVPHKCNKFGVVDRKTGVERVEVAGHMEACRAAQKLEDQAAFTQAAHLTASNMARWMFRWTAVFCLMIAAFAFFGVHP